MPGLRENLMERLSRKLIIDPEFATLIPPLTPDEFAGLEKSILEEGCRDALIVWDNIIVDGHNRFNICTQHNIPYRTEFRDFPNREAAMLWMLQNQLSRRNINDFQRVEMVRKCEQAVKNQARERQLSGLVQNTSTVREILPTRERATDELGSMAGVSRKTYEHAIAVLDNAPASVVEATRNAELSINAAYEVTKLPKDKQQEVSARIAQGEKPRKVISDIKHHKQKATSNMEFWNALIPNAEKIALDAQNIDSIIQIVSKALVILQNAVSDKKQH